MLQLLHHIRIGKRKKKLQESKRCLLEFLINVLVNQFEVMKVRTENTYSIFRADLIRIPSSESCSLIIRLVMYSFWWKIKIKVFARLEHWKKFVCKFLICCTVKRWQCSLLLKIRTEYWNSVCYTLKISMQKLKSYSSSQGPMSPKVRDQPVQSQGPFSLLVRDQLVPEWGASCFLCQEPGGSGFRIVGPGVKDQLFPDSGTNWSPPPSYWRPGSHFSDKKLVTKRL